MRYLRNNISLNHSGFSMIEALVAMGILSIVTFSILAIHEKNLKDHKTIEVQFAVADLGNEVFEAFSGEAACSAALASVRYDYSRNFAAPSIREIAGIPAAVNRPNSKPPDPDELFRPDDPSGWFYIISKPRGHFGCLKCPEDTVYKDGLVKINKITLGDYQSLAQPESQDDSAYLYGTAKIEIELESTKKISGSNIFKRNFNIFVSLFGTSSILPFSVSSCQASNYGRDVRSPFAFAYSTNGGPLACPSGTAPDFDNVLKYSAGQKLGFCF